MSAMREGGASQHVLDRAFEHEFPPIEQKRVGQLLAAFHRDDNSHVFGRILLKALTPGGENSIVDFGSGWRGVIDIKKGFVTSIAPDQEIRNAVGKQWRWEEISELVLDPDLIPEKIAAWKLARKEARLLKKAQKVVEAGARSVVSEVTEVTGSAEEKTMEVSEKSVEDISFEILEFLKYYQIKGQKLWVPTDEILENFKEYRKEDVLEALKLQYEYQEKIKKYPAFETVEKATWRYDVEQE